MDIKTEIWNSHEIRFVEKEPGDWWAVAKDVAESLGYALTTNMTKRIEQCDKGIAKWNTLGGPQEMLIISEDGIYDAIWGSHKPEAKEFRKWAKRVFKTLRQASGLEAFQVFRMLDKEHQKETMRHLSASLKAPARVDFIKANTIANKAVSTRHGHPKMIKKDQMTPDMLLERQPILDDTVKLMEICDSFGLSVSVSDAVYGKYCQ